MIGVLLIGVREVRVAQHGGGHRVVDRRPVNEAAVVRLLDHGHAVFAQILGDLLLRDDRRRWRRPQVLEPAVRAQVHAALRARHPGSRACR